MTQGQGDPSARGQERLQPRRRAPGGAEPSCPVPPPASRSGLGDEMNSPVAISVDNSTFTSGPSGPIAATPPLTVPRECRTGYGPRAEVPKPEAGRQPPCPRGPCGRARGPIRDGGNPDKVGDWAPSPLCIALPHLPEQVTSGLGLSFPTRTTSTLTLRPLKVLPGRLSVVTACFPRDSPGTLRSEALLFPAVPAEPTAWGSACSSLTGRMHSPEGAWEGPGVWGPAGGPVSPKPPRRDGLSRGRWEDMAS